jgi:hypothetical protein
VRRIAAPIPHVGSPSSLFPVETDARARQFVEHFLQIGHDSRRFADLGGADGAANASVDAADQARRCGRAQAALAAATVITAPPYEWPTSMTGPSISFTTLAM